MSEACDENVSSGCRQVENFRANEQIMEKYSIRYFSLFLIALTRLRRTLWRFNGQKTST